MMLTRRKTLALSACASAAALSGIPAIAWANAENTMKAVMEFTGGKEPASGLVALKAPEIAENGNTVPISVSVESDMTADSYVESVIVLAEGNPRPDVVTFHFSPLSGEAAATTRMRLARTQNVVAVAKMNDGSVFMDKREVKVTIGGCGG